MKSKILGLLAVTLLAGPMAANATAMQLVASRPTPFGISSFTIDFADTGDGLFSLEELTAFSGIFIPQGGFWEQISSVPAIAGFTVGSGTDWILVKGESSVSLQTDFWEYRLVGTPTVPEPGSLALLGLGLLGLGMTRRKA